MTLSFELDHIAVLGTDLDQAVSACETGLGMAMGPGGRHDRFGTHNRLLGLRDAIYLEAIAIDPEAQPPMDARWFGLDGFTGPARLNKWICRVNDISAALARFPDAGRPVEVSRGALRWTMSVPKTGELPFDGMFPALIEWHVDELPGQTLPSSDRRLDHLTVSHPRAQDLQAALAPVLDDPRIRFQSAPAGLAAGFSGGGQTWRL